MEIFKLVSNNMNVLNLRTWPARGRWSQQQLELYQVVLETQLSLISSIVPGVTTIDTLYRGMQNLLAKHLQSVGLIDKNSQYLSARLGFAEVKILVNH